MTIHRIHKIKGYSIICNEAALDPLLSWKAKGILWYLLTKPDGWQCKTSDLTSQSTDGRDSVLAGLKELEQQCYLVRWRENNKKGLIVNRSEIFESKADCALWLKMSGTKGGGLTDSGLTDSGLTDSGKPGRIINTERSITDLAITDPPPIVPQQKTEPEPGASEVDSFPAANSQIEPIEALPTSQPEPVAETRENPFPGQPKNPDLAVENKVVPPPCDTLDAVVDSDVGESVPGPWNFDRQAARFGRHPSPILRHYGIGYMAIARKGAFVEFSPQLVEGVKAVSGAWSTPLTCDGDAIAHLRNRLSQLLDERHYEAALGFLQQAWERGEDAISEAQEAQEAQERASIPEFVPRPIPAFSEGELGFLQGKGSFAAVIKGRSSSRRAS